MQVTCHHFPFVGIVLNILTDSLAGTSLMLMEQAVAQAADPAREQRAQAAGARAAAQMRANGKQSRADRKADRQSRALDADQPRITYIRARDLHGRT